MNNKRQEPFTQELFLPVSGYVKLYPREIAIINHPSFQRLRRMRQLGFAHVVFPGGIHTRLEHSIGAVHVAQLIIGHVNENHEKHISKDIAVQRGWCLVEINENHRHLIRLAALLHDIGHVPFGHTLEDELNHLQSHDGPERLNMISKKEYKHYKFDKSILDEGMSTQEQQPDSWCLKDLVNILYKDVTKSLEINEDITPFSVLCSIIAKPPKKKFEQKIWKKTEKELKQKLDLQLCRDIVGNTICADFLDYLFRDWYHLGKPLHEDKRLYQYMEARKYIKTSGENIDEIKKETQFVINVGSEEKIRHDALTCILDLLGARYKLAETVLFHRTKLAIIGLLDRCLLEIRELYKMADIKDIDKKFSSLAEQLLLGGSDDALPDILKKLAEGEGEGEEAESVAEALIQKTKFSSDIIRKKMQPDSLFSPDLDYEIGVEIDSCKEWIDSLINRLRERHIYKLAFKLKLSDIPGHHKPDNEILEALIEKYSPPDARRGFLRGLEALCDLPPHSLIMYCPLKANMNAKIAKVNLLIKEDVIAFDKYDGTDKGYSLTRGTLEAQTDRFYELWSAQIYVEHTTWDALLKDGQNHLKSVIKEFFFQKDSNVVQMNPGVSLDDIQAKKDKQKRMNDIRANMDIPIKKISDKSLKLHAAREESPSHQPDAGRFDDFIFPSGLPFQNLKKKR